MLSTLARLSCMVAAVFSGITVLTACGISLDRNTQAADTSPKLAAVTIPQAQELFAPFILTVQPGTTVTWQNSDTESHIIMTTWDHNSFLNPEAFSLKVAADQKASLTLRKPGLYDYFDNTQARWDNRDHRVAANKDVRNYPLAMEGIIWVQGSIEGLSSSMTNTIPRGKDDFTSDFLAIPQGGTVNWHNSDTDEHFVALVPGWSQPVNTVDPGVTAIKGTNGTPGGETKPITFTQPGLYYYYCPSHATINTSWMRAEANKDASEAPIPMEGFVLVTGN
ncbi:MAG: hypothetical protein JOZ18_19155 [Chloroflexi bacterium]|nr:hypothetical protein [Chloroflexota bacterium]